MLSRARGLKYKNMKMETNFKMLTRTIIYNSKHI